MGRGACGGRNLIAWERSDEVLKGNDLLAGGTVGGARCGLGCGRECSRCAPAAGQRCRAAGARTSYALRLPHPSALPPSGTEVLACSTWSE